MSNIHAELENVTAKLVVDDVSKTFNSARGKVEALKNVSLKVGEGEFVCLVGPSGCGKSTLLNLVAGLDKPDSGTIKVDDTPVSGPGRDRMVMFQEHALFPWLDVFDNVLFGLKLKPNLTNPERKEVAKFYLHLVGLEKFAHSSIHELSGGMRQRAAIARAIAVPSGLLLMDEPFGALDPVNRGLLQELIRNLHRDTGKRRTVIFVTHDIDEALYLGTRLVVFSSSPGRIIADEGNRISRRYDRTALFRQPEIKALQQKIPAVYRSDMLERLAKRSEVRNGGGI